MYENNFEENKNNEVEENKNNEVEEKKETEIDIEDIDGTEEEKKANWNKMIEEKNAYKGELNKDKTKKKKKTYSDFGLTPAQVLKFTKIAENDLKLEEIVKLIKKYMKELGVEDTKFFLEKVEEDIKNNFEKKSFESLKPKEEKK